MKEGFYASKPDICWFRKKKFLVIFGQTFEISAIVSFNRSNGLKFCHLVDFFILGSCVGASSLNWPNRPLNLNPKQTDQSSKRLFYVPAMPRTKSSMNQRVGVMACLDQMTRMAKTSIAWKAIWIYLKSQIKFWNLKIEFKSQKVLSCMKTSFKHEPFGLLPCAFI